MRLDELKSQKMGYENECNRIYDEISNFSNEEYPGQLEELKNNFQHNLMNLFKLQEQVGDFLEKRSYEEKFKNVM